MNETSSRDDEPGRRGDAKGAVVLEFGKIIKGAVEKQGMLGWQFNTVGVSDAITMGGDGQLPPPRIPISPSSARRPRA